MKKEYVAPTMRVRISNFDLMKRYPWSDMPATGGYAELQDKSRNVNEEEYGNIW